MPGNVGRIKKMLDDQYGNVLAPLWIDLENKEEKTHRYIYFASQLNVHKSINMQLDY